MVVGPVIAFSFIPPRKMDQFSIIDIRDEAKEEKDAQDNHPTKQSAFIPRVNGVRKVRTDGFLNP